MGQRSGLLATVVVTLAGLTACPPPTPTEGEGEGDAGEGEGEAAESCDDTFVARCEGDALVTCGFDNVVGRTDCATMQLRAREGFTDDILGTSRCGESVDGSARCLAPLTASGALCGDPFQFRTGIDARGVFSSTFPCGPDEVCSVDSTVDGYLVGVCRAGLDELCREAVVKNSSAFCASSGLLVSVGPGAAGLPGDCGVDAPAIVVDCAQLAPGATCIPGDFGCVVPSGEVCRDVFPVLGVCSDLTACTSAPCP